MPLVEDALQDMYADSFDGVSAEEDLNADFAKTAGLNGDNFYRAVLKSNTEMLDSMEEGEENGGGDEEEASASEEQSREFTRSLREAFGMEQTTEKPSKKSKRKKQQHQEKRPLSDDEDEPKSSAKKAKKSRPLDDNEKGSRQLGEETLEWLISPVTRKQFFSDSWERRPLHIKRGNSKHFAGLFSTKAFDAILRENNILYGKNLDVTSFSEDKRETHNPVGRAYPPVVWDYYNQGCSLRMLNPQTFDARVWELCATLQELFGSMVGANMYLTPPGTQGFAPHYDDVEVFILQIEGKKRWRLYEPRNNYEKLARFVPSEIIPLLRQKIMNKNQEG